MHLLKIGALTSLATLSAPAFACTSEVGVGFGHGDPVLGVTYTTQAVGTLQASCKVAEGVSLNVDFTTELSGLSTPFSNKGTDIYLGLEFEHGPWTAEVGYVGYPADDAHDLYLGGAYRLSFAEVGVVYYGGSTDSLSYGISTPEFGNETFSLQAGVWRTDYEYESTTSITATANVAVSDRGRFEVTIYDPVNGGPVGIFASFRARL